MIPVDNDTEGYRARVRVAEIKRVGIRGPTHPYIDEGVVYSRQHVPTSIRKVLLIAVVHRPVTIT